MKIDSEARIHLPSRYWYRFMNPESTASLVIHAYVERHRESNLVPLICESGELTTTISRPTASTKFTGYRNAMETHNKHVRYSVEQNTFITGMEGTKCCNSGSICDSHSISMTIPRLLNTSEHLTLYRERTIEDGGHGHVAENSVK